VRTLIATLAAVAVVAGQAAQTGGWELVVLGIAQDGGIPQLGCTQALCTSIRDGKRAPERVSSIGVVNRALNKAFLFDATPDMPSQIHSLTGGKVPDGIFLTHAHIGHYTGLMYLGREAVSAKSVPVYGTRRLHGYLAANGPWSQLVTLKNIEPRELVPGTPLELDGGLRVTALSVPHRDEFSDTVGYLIAGPNTKVLFIPDIDQWQKWSRNIRTLADQVDILLLDGTFASASEIPGRTISDIPHPLMPATRELLKGTKGALWFIHLNHTNQQIGAKDVVRDGQRFPL
jgi:pyrroloquinoline quinone biosynthesis protein B